MEKVTGKLTVFFDNPFWVGVWERIEENKLSVGKVVFGAKPKDYEVYDFVLKNYNNLQFSSSVNVDIKSEHTNSKRLQREARKESQKLGIGTKSQIALSIQREELKIERKILTKEKREAEKQRKFELKQEKRKQKHRGK